MSRTTDFERLSAKAKARRRLTQEKSRRHFGKTVIILAKDGATDKQRLYVFADVDVSVAQTYRIYPIPNRSTFLETAYPVLDNEIGFRCLEKSVGFNWCDSKWVVGGLAAALEALSRIGVPGRLLEVVAMRV